MSELARFVLLGLAVGALYALTAHGLVLIYRGTGIVNFAQGGFAALGAFFYYKGVERGFSLPVAWAVAIGVPALLGALTHLLVMRRLRRASPLVRLTATLAVFFLLIAIADQFWSDQFIIVQSPLPSTLRRPFGGAAAISEDRLWLIAIAVAITVVLHLAFKMTRFGQATEAVAENAVAASALGHSPDTIAVVNWAIGSALAAAAGIFIAPILTLNVAALAFTVLRSLAAALVGKFSSFWVTLGGAFAIGVTESVLSRYVADEGIFGVVTDEDGLFLGQFSAQSVSRSAAFLVIVLVLVVGGRALPLRSEVLDRMPALGSGRVRWWLLAPCLALMAWVMLSVPKDWATALVTSLGVSIVAISLVLVIGYVGQLSLAQMALAGFGVWVSSRLIDAAGWPLLLAVPTGIAATMVLGGFVAIPALRTRGVNLAVLTFGLAVMITELVLTNSSLTGGIDGTTVESMTLFGLDIDAVQHPGRYGVVVLVALTLAGLAVSNIRRGTVGRQLIAVRDNERAAAALGISVAEAKIYAFTVSAGIAALGGVMLAFRSRHMEFTQFGGMASINAVVYTVIGGVGFVSGGVLAGQFALGGIGARVFDAFGWGPTTLELVSGIVLVVVLLANPNGIAYEQVRIAQELGHRRRARRGADQARAPSTHPSEPIESQADDPEPIVGADRREGAAVEISNMSVTFGAVTAVDDVSLSILPGEVLGLIGPNGAGKTTVIDALTGFVATSSATKILVNGRSVEGLAPVHRARAGLGRSFQSLELFEDLTVRENLLAACDSRSRVRYVTELVVPRRGELNRAAELAIAEFGLESELDQLPAELALGRRRMVAVARVLAGGSGVVLLDEPAAGLNESESAEVGRLIRRLARDRGLAVMLIEHDVGMVMATCDRIAVLDFGRLIAFGDPASIAVNPAVRAAYLGEPDESAAAATS